MSPADRFLRTTFDRAFGYDRGEVQGVLEERQVEADLTIEIRSRALRTPRAQSDLHSLGVRLTEESRLLTLRGSTSSPTEDQLRVLADPLLETIETRGTSYDGLESRAHATNSGFREPGEPSLFRQADRRPWIDVFTRAGVTDAEGDMAAQALAHGGMAVRCRSGTRFRFQDTIPQDLRHVIERHLGNPLIHSFRWHDQPGNTADPIPHDSIHDSVMVRQLHDVRMVHAPAIKTEGKMYQLSGRV